MASADDQGPYDGASYSEDFWRNFFQYRTGTGVVSGVGAECAVAQHSGGDQTVDVAAGEWFIRGQWGKTTATKNIGLSAAHATLARIDRIVLRNDFTANLMSIEVLEGTPGATPSIPALTQSSSRWEVGLARIARAATDNVIGTADITDERTFLTFDGITGLPIKATVRAASITNVTLASACEAGDTFGGVTLAYGDRIGLFGQTTASEDGIYLVNQTGAPTRAPDADTSAKMRPNTLVGVSEGTLADKWYQLTTNAPIVLGTTNQVWVEFGAGGYQAESGVAAYNSAAQTIASLTATALLFNTEEIDQGGYHSTVSATSRLVAPATGYYLCGGGCEITSLGAGQIVLVDIAVNGTAKKFRSKGGPPGSSVQVTGLVSLTAGDYVELIVTHNDSVSRDTVATVSNGWMQRVA